MSFDPFTGAPVAARPARRPLPTRAAEESWGGRGRPEQPPTMAADAGGLPAPQAPHPPPRLSEALDCLSASELDMLQAALCQERDALSSELTMMGPRSGRTMAARERRAAVERRLTSLGAELSAARGAASALR